jgi:hypothetical protein
VEIESLEGTISYDHITRSVDSKISAKLISAGSTSLIGANLAIDSIFRGDVISFDNIQLKGDMTVKKLPLKLLDMSMARSQLACIIGDTIEHQHHVCPV